VDAALRRAIPASNPEVRNVQRALEDISFKLRIPQRKPWQAMTDDIVKATKVMVDEQKVQHSFNISVSPRFLWWIPLLAPEAIGSQF